MENPNDNLNGQPLSKRERRLLKKQRKERERLQKAHQRKIKKIISLVLPIILIVGAVFLWPDYSPKKKQNQNNEGQEKPKITVFYSPTCSCCKEYISYLKKQDFQVEAKATQDMLSIKEKYQIPSEMESCHTSVIGDYFVEGHMSVEVIKKLLKEKPEIDGIALPGMPAGSPGMAGFKRGQFEIYGLKNGQLSEFVKF